jgi:hypothetical protein
MESMRLASRSSSARCLSVPRHTAQSRGLFHLLDPLIKVRLPLLGVFRMVVLRRFQERLHIRLDYGHALFLEAVQVNLLLLQDQLILEAAGLDGRLLERLLEGGGKDLVELLTDGDCIILENMPSQHHVRQQLVQLGVVNVAGGFSRPSITRVCKPSFTSFASKGTGLPTMAQVVSN